MMPTALNPLWVVPISFLVGVSGAVYFWSQAMRYLSPHGEERRQTIWMQGLMARRENFTEAGWRYRQRSLACLLIPVVAVSAYPFVDSVVSWGK